MERRTGAILLVTLLFLAVGIIQFTDPQIGEQTPPEVDFSESSGEVVADAATQLEYADYEYQTEILYSGKKVWRQVGYVRVHNSDHEYISFGPLGSRGSKIYGNDAVAYFKPSPESSWTVRTSKDLHYPASGFTQPINIQNIRSSEAIIRSENASIAIIEIDANIQKFSSDYPGTTTIFIDKKSRMVSKAITEFENDAGNTTKLRITITTHNQPIDRPPLSFWEYIFDIVRGPVFDY